LVSFKKTHDVIRIGIFADTSINLNTAFIETILAEPWDIVVLYINSCPIVVGTYQVVHQSLTFPVSMRVESVKSIGRVDNMLLFHQYGTFM